jgi:hypothetical protein
MTVAPATVVRRQVAHLAVVHRAGVPPAVALPPVVRRLVVRIARIVQHVPTAGPARIVAHALIVQARLIALALLIAQALLIVQAARSAEVVQTVKELLETTRVAKAVLARTTVTRGHRATTMLAAARAHRATTMPAATRGHRATTKAGAVLVYGPSRVCRRVAIAMVA